MQLTNRIPQLTMEAGAADSSAAPPTGKRAVASVADERASVANSRPLHAAKRKCARVPHDGSKAYVCPKCKKEFESQQSLDYHYTSRPSWMVRSACPPCLASCACIRECLFQVCVPIERKPMVPLCRTVDEGACAHARARA